MAKAEELKKARTNVAQLGGKLTRLREEVPSLRPQLDQARTAATLAVSEFQTLEEMAVTKKSSHDAGFNVGMQALTYIVVMEHLDWDLSFFGKELSVQVVVWRDQWQASLPPSDEPLTPLSAELFVPLSHDLPRTLSGEY